MKDVTLCALPVVNAPVRVTKEGHEMLVRAVAPAIVNPPVMIVTEGSEKLVMAGIEVNEIPVIEIALGMLKVVRRGVALANEISPVELTNTGKEKLASAGVVVNVMDADVISDCMASV